MDLEKAKSLVARVASAEAWAASCKAKASEAAIAMDQAQASLATLRRDLTVCLAEQLDMSVLDIRLLPIPQAAAVVEYRRAVELQKSPALEREGVTA